MSKEQLQTLTKHLESEYGSLSILLIMKKLKITYDAAKRIMEQTKEKK